MAEAAQNKTGATIAHEAGEKSNQNQKWARGLMGFSGPLLWLFVERRPAAAAEPYAMLQAAQSCLNLFWQAERPQMSS